MLNWTMPLCFEKNKGAKSGIVDHTGCLYSLYILNCEYEILETGMKPVFSWYLFYFERFPVYMV